MTTDFLPIADQINLLFQVVLHPEGRPYTLDEVSQPSGLSVATLSQLRTGRITNPQLSTLRALCDFFHIPLRYFETRTLEACYALLAEGQNSAPPPRTERNCLSRYPVVPRSPAGCAEGDPVGASRGAAASERRCDSPTARIGRRA
ncbi:MAG TPA: helix-turn-helix transcriptional regulator [Phototrophicaceae bacterium]|nr:helix-turn-helix transcriptional regulator [Phototrophicaceae bacterium]